jgi:hypothetical protein
MSAAVDGFGRWARIVEAHPASTTASILPNDRDPATVACAGYLSRRDFGPTKSMVPPFRPRGAIEPQSEGAIPCPLSEEGMRAKAAELDVSRHASGLAFGANRSPDWHLENHPTRCIHHFDLQAQAACLSHSGGFAQNFSGALDGLSANSGHVWKLISFTVVRQEGTAISDAKKIACHRNHLHQRHD